jgi:peptidyl-prolyl cis-trans isomerase D
MILAWAAPESVANPNKTNWSMLRGIHKASANWLGRVVMGVILGLIAISFGIWGIGDIFRGVGQLTVAKVGNTEIRVDGFRQIYQDKIQELGRRIGRPILPDQARALGLDRQLLGEWVAEALLDERARSMRLSISDAEIARRISDNPLFKGLGGQFDHQRFLAIIRDRGYNEPRYLAEQRRIAARQQIVGTVSSEVAIPKAAIEVITRFQNEQRTVEYVLIDAGKVGEVAAPAPDVLAKYFEERKVVFRAPEYRKVSVLAMVPAEVAKTIEVSDADVQKAYEDRKARYVTPERRQIQQIVFPNMDEAKAAAEKATKGAKFADLAAERGLKDADIDLGTVAKTALVDRAVADAAFVMKEGEISAPVEGRFGIVILHVVKIEPAQSKTLEQVAAELKLELATDRAKTQMSDLHDKIEDDRLSGVSLADIAKKFKLALLTIEATDKDGRAPDGTPVVGLPQNVNVLTPIFAADVHGDHDPIQAPGGGYVWYDVAEIKKARDRPLEEVKAQVETRWRDDEIATRIRAKATELLDKLKAGAKLSDIASANGLKVETANWIKRGAPPAGIPARAVGAIFSTPKDQIGSADGANAADRILFRVTEIVVPAFDPASDDAKRIAEGLRRVIADDMYAQYIGRLETEVGVTINQNALSQVTRGSSQQ